MIGLLLAATALQASAPLDAFVAEVRAGTARYHDRNVAIADGYRAAGPDAPGMGQHWMHPGLVLSGRLDPRRPQVLSYIIVDGRPRLAGVAFAIPSDRPLPPSPVPDSAWHQHGRSIDEEAFVADHRHQPGIRVPGTRLAVLHVWAWQENPEGMLAADNWSLPFVRLGLAVPPRFDPDAARALSLVLPGGRDFLARAYPSRSGLDARRAAVERRLLARRGKRLSDQDLRWLAETWTGDR